MVGKESNQEPRWLKKIYTGFERFLTNANDPWLSEADKDPLACESCSCFQSCFGGGPKRPGLDPGGNCITRHINDEVGFLLNTHPLTRCFVAKAHVKRHKICTMEPFKLSTPKKGKRRKVGISPGDLLRTYISLSRRVNE